MQVELPVGAVGATVPPVGGHIPGALAGIRFVTAYADTQFSNCSFQNTDFYEKEIVQMNVSLTDLSGDPCEFSALCTTKEYAGFTGQGFGETVLRDVILDESYLQNHFSNDVRIREITQGNQIITSVNRSALYFRYMLQHNVPRNYNPSGTFDSDQYVLEIFSLTALTTFYTDTAGWLEHCGVCETEEYTCSTTCVVPIPFPALPVFNPYNTVSCWGL